MKTPRPSPTGALRSSDRSGRLARRQDHDHLPAFHARRVLDLGHFLEIGLDLVEQLHAQLGVGHFATAEAQGDLHLVAFLEEARHGLGLHLIVVGVDVRPKLDLLELDDLLALARLGLLLLLLEAELAVIENLGDRRVGGGDDLDQVQPGLLGGLEGGGGGHDPLLLAVLINEQPAGGADILVHTRPVLYGRRLHGTANGRRFLMWSRTACSDEAKRATDRGVPLGWLYDRESPVLQGWTGFSGPMKASWRSITAEKTRSTVRSSIGANSPRVSFDAAVRVRGPHGP